jgi:hypothetical protein
MIMYDSELTYGEVKAARIALRKKSYRDKVDALLGDFILHEIDIAEDKLLSEMFFKRIDIGITTMVELLDLTVSTRNEISLMDI